MKLDDLFLAYAKDIFKQTATISQKRIPDNQLKFNIDYNKVWLLFSCIYMYLLKYKFNEMLKLFHTNSSFAHLMG